MINPRESRVSNQLHPRSRNWPCIWSLQLSCLLVVHMVFMTFHKNIGNFIIPTAEVLHIFQRGRYTNHQPDSHTLSIYPLVNVYKKNYSKSPFFLQQTIGNHHFSMGKSAISMAVSWVFVALGRLHGPPWPARMARAGKDVMVCTNLASRGLDFSNATWAAVSDGIDGPFINSLMIYLWKI